jgi:hypothetical protein
MVRNQPHSNTISASAEHPLPRPLFEHEGIEADLGSLFESRARRTSYAITVMIRETSA